MPQTRHCIISTGVPNSHSRMVSDELGGGAMKKSIFFTVLIVFISFSTCFADDYFRCGSGLISVGDSKFVVLGKCGEPTVKEVTGDQASGGFASTTRKRAKGDRRPSQTKGTYTENIVTLEAWTYNCGSSEFSYTLTFRGQALIGIENIGYGYGQSDCIGRELRNSR